MVSGFDVMIRKICSMWILYIYLYGGPTPTYTREICSKTPSGFLKPQIWIVTLYVFELVYPNSPLSILPYFFQPADVPMSLEQFQVFEIEIIDTEGRFKGWNSWYVLEICPCTLGRGCLYFFLWRTFMINPWVQFRQAVCRDVLLLTSSHSSLQERGMKDEVFLRTDSIMTVLRVLFLFFLLSPLPPPPF